VGEREQRRIEAEQVTSKLAVFLEHRRRAPSPEGTHTLIEIESADQLEAGVRILHPHFGVGEIRHVVNRKLRVAFGDTMRMIAPTRELRIVQD
jgi:hypothetical protein